MGVLFIVLRVLIIALAVATPIFLVVAIASGVQVFPAGIVGVISVLVMLAGAFTLVTYMSRRHRARGELERLDVWIGAEGVMLRGVGPIPWHDFEPARHQLVPAEHDSGYVSRAVMPLTPSGVFNVNNRLAPQLRERVCPVSGPMWKKMHYWVYVPGVEGLAQNEVMDLINRGHWMYARARYTA